MMDLPDITLSELKQSEYWTPKTRISGNTIQGLTCSVCGFVGVGWAYLSAPYSINCNRLNHCGARTKTLDLLDIRKDIEKHFKPTRQDPQRPARAYLESRGIRQALKGLKFYYQKNVRNSGTGAVMFPIGKDEKGKTVANGRLLSPPSGVGKTHNSGSTSGIFWQHPGIEYDPYSPTYVVEGIIDALSLVEIGHQAIAVLAAGQDPKKLDLARFKKLVPAFDNDLAGARATKKWIDIYPDMQPIMPDRGMDWNDLLCSGPAEDVKKRFSESLPRFLVNAQLALAGSAHEYATIYHGFFGYPPGIFVHDGCTHFAFLKKRGDEARLVVERCGRFTLKVVSYRKDTSNPENPEYRYHLEIQPKGSRPVQTAASGRDLATPRGLKEFFLTRAKVAFEANANAATAIATTITSSKAPRCFSTP
ncbi:hypothetical protein GF1_11720 [Desulfolithobacter dissulfuricans]|uniref:Toprim domain-containing protein n=1 Tax=Desulfolithobacter dissulfuricans TaxID=2795293 RepID=A0A915U9C0_9BACT|nr:toprim domain-containing protein [Desulfolithobacter dissulfuricans]BCO08796.1 hypothetical protein GF1_11720 [Desulfolithobacter dissulfuricans]